MATSASHHCQGSHLPWAHLRIIFGSSFLHCSSFDCIFLPSFTIAPSSLDRRRRRRKRVKASSREREKGEKETTRKTNKNNNVETTTETGTTRRRSPELRARQELVVGARTGTVVRARALLERVEGDDDDETKKDHYSKVLLSEFAKPFPYENRKALGIRKIRASFSSSL